MPSVTSQRRSKGWTCLVSRETYCPLSETLVMMRVLHNIGPRSIKLPHNNSLENPARVGIGGGGINADTNSGDLFCSQTFQEENRAHRKTAASFLTPSSVVHGGRCGQKAAVSEARYIVAVP